MHTSRVLSYFSAPACREYGFYECLLSGCWCTTLHLFRNTIFRLQSGCIFRTILYHRSDANLTTYSGAKFTSIPDQTLPVIPLESLPDIPGKPFRMRKSGEKMGWHSGIKFTTYSAANLTTRGRFIAFPHSFGSHQNCEWEWLINPFVCKNYVRFYYSLSADIQSAPSKSKSMYPGQQSTSMRFFLLTVEKATAHF